MALCDFVRQITVEPVSFLYILAVLAEFTSLQELLFTSVCLDVQANATVGTCNKHALLPAGLQTDISAIVSIKLKWYMMIMGITGTVSMLWLGSWSDVLGRKAPMRLPSALGLMAQVLFIAASLFKQSLNTVQVLFYLAAFFNGLSGGVANLVSTCNGYISDITDNAHRTKRIIFVEAAFFVGSFLGYNLAGVALTYVMPQKYEQLFMICAALHIVILIYISLVLRDTRTGQSGQQLIDGQEWTIARLFSLRHIECMFRTVFKRRTGCVRNMVVELLFCSVIAALAMQVQTNLTFLFVKRPPLSFQASMYSLYSGLHVLLSGLSLLVLHILVVRHNWLRGTFVGMIGFFSRFCGLLAFGLANHVGVVFLAIPLFIFSEYPMPSIRSILSKVVDPDEKGKIFAFVAALQNLVGIVGSYIFYSAFYATANWFPGLTFIVVAVVQLIAIAVLWIVHRQYPELERSRQSSPEAANK